MPHSIPFFFLYKRRGGSLSGICGCLCHRTFAHQIEHAAFQQVHCAHRGALVYQGLEFGLLIRAALVVPIQIGSTQCNGQTHGDQPAEVELYHAKEEKYGPKRRCSIQHRPKDEVVEFVNVRGFRALKYPSVGPVGLYLAPPSQADEKPPGDVFHHPKVGRHEQDAQDGNRDEVGPRDASVDLGVLGEPSAEYVQEERPGLEEEMEQTGHGMGAVGEHLHLGGTARRWSCCRDVLVGDGTSVHGAAHPVSSRGRGGRGRYRRDGHVLIYARVHRRGELEVGHGGKANDLRTRLTRY
mmetsp:Transcript_33964/g.100086  ORF Transcript_33964/g.100086 Transcript_33964/m.100086 type:complete len:296 (-) Transcript_33964:99-986(-)